MQTECVLKVKLSHRSAVDETLKQHFVNKISIFCNFYEAIHLKILRDLWFVINNMFGKF